MPSDVFPVLASHDDAFAHIVESSSICYNEANTLDLLYVRPAGWPYVPIERRISGVRFDGITIPQGSRITQAYMRLRAHAGWPSMDIIIRGIDQGNPPPFEAPTCNPENRPVTSAGVLWTTGAVTTGTWYSTPSLVTVVQALVNRADYASVLAFKLNRNGGGGEMTFTSVDGGHPPELHVTWQTAGVQGYIL